MIFSAHTPRCFHTAMLFLVLFAGARDVLADFAAISADGWYTWRVDAVADAPDWCCWSNRKDRYYGGGCSLDSRNHGFMSIDESNAMPGEMQVYVHMQDGALNDIRTVSEFCPVRSESPVTDFGKLPGDESIAWLRPQIGSASRTSSHVLAAIAVHAGDVGNDTLFEIAAGDADFENRKDAIFWLGQVRATEAETRIEELMFEDPDPDFREHAAFSLSQSDAPGRVAALARLGREDDAAEVRSQAWFWLAQTGAPQAAAEIRRAISDEQDIDVREEAVFALSQLPEESAATALVDIIESRDLHYEVRKTALFWLAQVESDQALDYIDRLLNGS